MNQNLDASARAMVFSLHGQVDAFAAIVGGSILGAIATAFTTRPALIVGAIMPSPTVVLSARTVRRPAGAGGEHVGLGRQLAPGPASSAGRRRLAR